MAEKAGKNEKYIVFKRADWDQMMVRITQLCPGGIAPAALGPLMALEANGSEVEDAVVIRRQDVFSPGMLAAYAHSIQIALKVASLHEFGELNEVGRRLSAIADYFHEQSELAYAESYKIPD